METLAEDTDGETKHQQSEKSWMPPWQRPYVTSINQLQIPVRSSLTS